ncbi:superoxide dismutase family protein [Sphingomonas gilva]|uniref:Superoxide dismutase [Cu-Zn] n=1 Tax=Sphingomonas gilva TaxID=2305907 RepID=A0A396RWS7_9SPHN|nr:superoxide dismutase family protein [Sphingomonas gilva]RHW18923.1 superoxide dismutase family protein [Sphingomonas gilva]
MRTLVFAAASALTLAACNAQPAENAAAANDTAANNTTAAAPGARADVAMADATPAGAATIKEEDGGLKVSFMGQRLPIGPHAVHIHTTGKCDGPDFQSAGGHWNPENKQHGTENPAGPHKGDLPNMTVAGNGTGSILFTIPDTTLAALMDADGAALVVHADADDNVTDPAGNAGGRIACGVINAA